MFVFLVLVMRGKSSMHEGAGPRHAARAAQDAKSPGLTYDSGPAHAPFGRVTDRSE
jgi:hypothetical protein